jgi:hypothetical protein
MEAYVNSAWVNLSSADSLLDADSNTGILVERTSDENQIHFFTEASGDVAHIRNNGNIELNNLQISNQTITGLSTNLDITITPNGTGQVAMTSVDIAGGEIDGTVIGANSAAAGTFTTVDTSGNVTVGGNLTVNGTTTTIDTETLSIEDPLIVLSKNNSGGSANTYDQGILFNRGSFSNVAFFWDESTDEFAFATTSAETGATAGNITVDSYQKLHAGIIVAGTSLDTGAIKAVDGTAAITIASSTGVITASTNLNANAGLDIEADNQSFTVGASADFTIAHDGTNTTLDNNTGILKILGASGSSIQLNADAASVDTQISGDNTAALLFVKASTDKIGIATNSPSYILDINDTGAIRLPQGNTAARPTAATGVIRFNTQTGNYEGSQDGSTWVSFVTTDGTTPAISKVSATGDGSTTTFTGFFSATPVSAANVLVFIDNVHQEPTENYTISGTNITFSEAPHPSARIYALIGFDSSNGGGGGGASIGDLTIDGTTISSGSSSKITLNESVDITGTLQVNEISSADSTAIQVNDAVNISGAGTFHGSVRFNAGYTEKINTLTSSSTITVNCATSSVHTVTLTASTGFVITSLPTGGTVTLIITQDGTGARTATFGTDTSTAVKFPGGTPTLTGSPGSIDIVTVFNDGTNYLGNVIKNYT